MVIIFVLAGCCCCCGGGGGACTLRANARNWRCCWIFEYWWLLINWQICLHNAWNWRVEPVINVNKILYFWKTSCWFSFWAIGFGWLKFSRLFSATISTLNLTFRDKNLSGERYSHRNKVGLLILWIKSDVLKKKKIKFYVRGDPLDKKKSFFFSIKSIKSIKTCFWTINGKKKTYW